MESDAARCSSGAFGWREPMTTRRVIQLLNGVALLIGVLWFIFKPDFEPALTSLALLATLIGLIVEERVSSAHAVDQELFQRLRQDLPSNGSIAFIDTNNFAGFSFELSRLSDLDTFVHVWDDAEHEFLNKKLEQKRQQLMALVKEYLSVIALQTFPTHTSGWNSVPEEWEHEQPQRFNEVVTKLHNLAGQIVQLHQDLFRTARKKLKC
jgi:hypothetical protein